MSDKRFFELGDFEAKIDDDSVALASGAGALKARLGYDQIARAYCLGSDDTPATVYLDTTDRVWEPRGISLDVKTREQGEEFLSALTESMEKWAEEKTG